MNTEKYVSIYKISNDTMICLIGSRNREYEIKMFARVVDKPILRNTIVKAVWNSSDRDFNQTSLSLYEYNI